MTGDSKSAKERNIARFMKRRAERLELERRNPNQLRYPNPEETAEVFRRQRAEREAAIVETKVKGEWLQVSEIVDDVAKSKDAQFDSKKRNKIAIEVCERFVLDSAAGRLGTEQTPVLMLLSKEYDETPLTPSQLSRTIKSAYDGMSGNKKRRAIAEFLQQDGWIKRDAADQCLGAGNKDHSQNDYYDLPNDEPKGREAQKAYRALRKRYGMKVPKLSLQQLANNISGPGSTIARDAVARVLGKK